MEDENRQQRISQAAQTALNLSHGVKNVLQAVKGGIEVVDKGLEINDIQRAKRGWKILRKNLNQIEKLVLDMLQFSRESELNITDCDLNELVESTVDLLRPGAEELNKHIFVTTDKEIETVPLDADKFSDVILNLTLNAIYAVSRETGVVNVSTEAKGDTVIFRVSDNGPGIEDIQAIFEPFHTTKANVGTGLGLPIAKKIVAGHHGKIEVQTQPGKGATFTVTLPAKRS